MAIQLRRDRGRRLGFHPQLLGHLAGCDRCIDPFTDDSSDGVAATNRSPLGEVYAGRFRADLYYRLAVFPIRVPALRQRAADIPSLVDHFLARYQREERKEKLALSHDALEPIAAYRWPGNVLEHELHRLVLTLPSGTRIAPEHLAPAIRHHAPVPIDEPPANLLAHVELSLIASGSIGARPRLSRRGASA